MAVDLHATRRVRPVVNVTPLVDVVLVLLIVFMVVAPLLEKELDVRLPITRRVEEVPPGAQLVLAVTAEGEVRLNGATVALRDLRTRLPPLLGSHADSVVFFQAEDEARFGLAVAVLDAARGAGARRIATVLASPPSGKDR